MHPDTKHDVQVVSMLQTARYDGLSQTEECSTQVALMMAESPERILQAATIEKRQKKREWRPSPTQWSLTLMIGDGLLILASLASLLVLAPSFNLAFHILWNEPGTWSLKLIWSCIALLSWSIAVNITRAQDLQYASNRFKSPFRAVCTLMLMVIFWIVFTYPFIGDRFLPSIALLLLFLLVAIPCLSAWRIALAELMRLPRFRIRAVIIGSTVAGETIAREYKVSRRPDMNLLGYISEGAGENMQKEGLSVLGGRNILRNLIHNGMIDRIIMATDYKAEPALFQDAIEATQLGVSLVPMPVAYESIGGKIPVEHIGDQWYLSLPVEVMVSPFYLCWRKVMDLAFGLVGALSLLLVFPILALLIILDSPGPVFYKQERLGRNGQKFFIYKFRSMHINAEKAGKALWSGKGDKRITKAGRFLRVTHLDELPQVLNILRGEMSLIGPRPEREVFVTMLEKNIPFYRCRLMVRPGLTGWAQVKYPYGGTNEGTLAKLQYDLYYIKHQSFTLDIWIILKTVAEVLFCRGI